jgi:hypothetical protein
MLDLSNAVYGPVCTVVWEGRSRESSPYPDQGWAASSGIRTQVAMEATGVYWKMGVTGRTPAIGQADGKLLCIRASAVVPVVCKPTTSPHGRGPMEVRLASTTPTACDDVCPHPDCN